MDKIITTRRLSSHRDFLIIPSPLSADVAIRLQPDESFVRLAEYGQDNIIKELRVGYVKTIKPKLKEREKYELMKKMPETNDHIISIRQVLHRFQVTMMEGLSTEEADRRKGLFGLNVMTPPREVPLAVVFLKQMVNGFAILLWTAAAISIGAYYLDKKRGAQNLYLAAALGLAVLLTGVFSFVQEHNSSKVMSRFKHLLPAIARVVRGGVIVEIPASQLVRELHCVCLCAYVGI